LQFLPGNVNGTAVVAAYSGSPPDNDNQLKADGTGKSFYDINTRANLSLVLA
jgi:hypothetical protein